MRVTTCFRRIALGCESGIWCLFPQTPWVSSIRVCETRMVHIISSVTNSTKATKMPPLSNIPWNQGAPLLPDLFPALSMLSSCYSQSSLGGKGEDTLLQAHVPLPDKNLQEFLMPKAEVWPHLRFLPFPSLLTGGSPSWVKTKSFPFLPQFLYLKLVQNRHNRKYGLFF